MRSLSLPAALALLSATAPAQTQAHAIQPFPLVNLGHVVNDDVLLYGFDASAWERLAAPHTEGRGVRFEGVALPDGRLVALELLPVSAMGPGARAKVFQADGSVSWLEPRTRCFAGFVEGGGAAFFGATPEAVHGYLVVGDELFVLSSDTGQAGRATLASGSALDLAPPSVWCGAGDAVDGTHGKEGFRPFDDGADVQRVIGGGNYDVRTADVLLETDHRVRARFNSDQACVDYVNLLISTIGTVYRRDLGVLLNIPDGYLRVYNTTPPWGELTGFNSINGFRSWWRSTDNPDRFLPRAAVHALTNPVFGGVAISAGGLCLDSQAYEVSSINGSFPSPLQHTSPGNWDLVVVSHEFGHTFGSPHTFSYAPPINCFDGSGPDNGTIMSYCHLETGGINNIGIRFHQRVQDYLIERLGIGGCLERTTFRQGDYDLDGDRDLDDLAVLDGILGQGFVSRGAETVFDFNADGRLDFVDRETMLSIASGDPPATTVNANGSGVNTTCFATLTAPILGTNWDVGVFGGGLGITTWVYGSTGPSAGIALAGGELLIDPAHIFYSHAAPLIGLFGLHRLPLPFDTALIGASASFQGLTVSSASGTDLCNRIDVTLGLYLP